MAASSRQYDLSGSSTRLRDRLCGWKTSEPRVVSRSAGRDWRSDLLSICPCSWTRLSFSERLLQIFTSSVPHCHARSGSSRHYTSKKLCALSARCLGTPALLVLEGFTVMDKADVDCISNAHDDRSIRVW